MRAPIGADIAKVYNMFGAEAVDEGVEALSLDAADGQHQCLDPRRRDGQEGIHRHCYRAAVIPTYRVLQDQHGARQIERVLDMSGSSCRVAHRGSRIEDREPSSRPPSRSHAPQQVFP